METNKTDNSTKKSGKGRIFKISAATIAIIAVVVLFLLTSSPNRYEPANAQTVNGEQSEVNSYLTHQLAPAFFNGMQTGEPFDITVEQERINELIADNETLENMFGFRWPVVFAEDVSVSDPSTAFYPGRIDIMALVRLKSPALIATLTMKPVIDEDGMLVVNIDKVKAGRINITPLAKTIARYVINDYLESDPNNADLRTVSAVCLDNKPVEPIFPAENGKYVKITAIKTEDEKCTLTFEPLDE